MYLDFGKPGYGRRGGKEIKEHLALLSTDDVPDRDAPLDLFDYWRDPSESPSISLSASCG